MKNRKVYDDLIQGMDEAISIEKGELELEEHMPEGKSFPAKTYRVKSGKKVVDKGEKPKIRGLKKALRGVSDSYEGFVKAVMAFAKEGQDNVEVIKRYLKDNPEANSSDILEYMINLPGFLNEGRVYDHYYHRRKLINAILRDNIPSRTYRDFLAEKHDHLTEYEATWLVHQIGFPSEKEMDIYGMIAALTTDKKLERALLKILEEYYPRRNHFNEAEYRIQPYFDDKFIACPNPFRAGDIVTYKPSRKKYHVGVVVSNDSYKEMAKNVEKGAKLDASDASIIVDWVGEDGSFSHEHICPVHLAYSMLTPRSKWYEKIRARSYEAKKEGM